MGRLQSFPLCQQTFSQGLPCRWMRTQQPSSSGHATTATGITHFSDLSKGSTATPTVNSQPIIQMIPDISVLLSNNAVRRYAFSAHQRGVRAYSLDDAIEHFPLLVGDGASSPRRDELIGPRCFQSLANEDAVRMPHPICRDRYPPGRIYRPVVFGQVCVVGLREQHAGQYGKNCRNRNHLIHVSPSGGSCRPLWAVLASD